MTAPRCRGGALRSNWAPGRRRGRSGSSFGDVRRMSLERVGVDRYGGTLARVRVGGVDVARAMIVAGMPTRMSAV